MMADSMESALTTFLAERNSVYAGKIQELREVLQEWLAYIPHTFPHYTRHTIGHSDEIILQLSKLLFEDDDPACPTVSLSATEAYILIASAYLHDAGMVASDSEKVGILSSDEWEKWTQGEGGGAKRWAEIDDFRRGQTPKDPGTRNFLADVQSRFLISEFIRARHHLRSADVIAQHQSALGRFAFDDAQLQEAIANVCVGHGLPVHELRDDNRYPERRDIRGEPVNLRFMSILLRIGDLLDMSSDRACPLLANAASPLPSESFAHWTQYKCIKHRMTARDEIQISASCETQDEHRTLHDWCQWLEDEVNNASSVMSNAARHGDWRPPHISATEPNRTIHIEPSESASYVPSNWELKFDREAIMERLIYDVHGDSTKFVLELIQNALDASRAKMLRDISPMGEMPQSIPSRVAPDVRSRYPINIELREIETTNELSGERVTKQILSVEDFGTGMDRSIVERFFLQIGRSYYASDEFRRINTFNPISQFGIGFLSVFAVSDHVVVETYKHDGGSVENPPGLRLTLTGPTSYLLHERGTRGVNGTRIEVTLREPLKRGLAALVSEWCRMVEFPVVVRELGVLTEVSPETHDRYSYDVPDLSQANGRFIVRSFDLDLPQVDGHLFVFAQVGDDGERWDRRAWANEVYPVEYPAASMLPGVTDLYCVHGISRSGRHRAAGSSMATRIDYRGVARAENLSRGTRPRPIRGGRVPLDSKASEGVEARWREILSEHLAIAPLAQNANGWRYKQRLVSCFPVDAFWESQPGMIPIYNSGVQELMSLDAFRHLPTIRVTMGPLYSGITDDDRLKQRTCEAEYLAMTDVPSMTSADLHSLDASHRSLIFRDREVVEYSRSTRGEISLLWDRVEREIDQGVPRLSRRPVDIVEFPDGDITVGFATHRTVDSVYDHAILNSKNLFVQWLLKLQSESVENGEIRKRFRMISSLLETPLSHNGYEFEKLTSYMEKWRALPVGDSHTRPPDVVLSQGMFCRPRTVDIGRFVAHELKGVVDYLSES